MFKIKNKPEDFRVKEVLDLKVKDNGPYAYVLLKKTKWTTTKAIEELARKLNISKGRISVAGMKDKYGITEQYVCIKDFDLKKIKNVKINDIELKAVGYGSRRIGIGKSSGNRFVIVVRNLDKELKPVKFVPNYYDDQRFGEVRPNTHLVGKELVKKNYLKAMKVYLCYPFFTETLDHQEWREKLEKRWGNFEDIKTAKGMYYERKVLSVLKDNPKDYIGAFRNIPRQLLTLFVQSYQSWIFNKTLNEYITDNYRKTKRIDYVAGEFAFLLDVKDEDKELDIPMVGYTNFKTSKEINQIINDIFKKERIKQSDFRFAAMKELSSKTIMRKAFVKVRDLKIGELEKDEMNKDKFKQKIEFKIRKGSYATTVIKAMYSLS